MSTDMDVVLDALGVHAAGGAADPTGGMSGSTVVGALTGAGDPVIVKVTEFATRDAARRALRELEVYTDLSRRLAVPAPRLVAAHRTESWIAIAIQRHEPAPAASEWTMEQWRDLAILLGRMHRDAREVADGSAPAEPTEPLTQDALFAFAQQLWNGPGDAARLGTVLADIDRLRDAVEGGPTSFVHGDSHLGNVVRTADGTPLLVDWQSAHVGPSAGDIAFALTRAATGATVIPRKQVIDAYSTTAGVDAGLTRRAVTAHQLLILVEQYPEYAAFLSPEAVERLRRTVDVLLHDWVNRGQ